MKTAPKNYLAPLKEVQQRFDQALRAADPRPSAVTLQWLARELQKLVNRRANLDAPPESLKDVNADEELYKRVRKVKQAVEDVRSAARELEDYTGNYIWMAGDKSISLQEMEEVLSLVSVAPVPPERWPSRPPARGRPVEPWHDVGEVFAQLVKSAMEDIDFKGRIRPTDEESITATVGARAINWAYGIQIEPETFATAMRRRDRSKKAVAIRKQKRDIPSVSEMFPGAKRIKESKFR